MPEVIRGAMDDSSIRPISAAWKIGTPIAKCKNKDCATRAGSIWEDSVPKDTPHGPPHATPQPIAAVVPPSPRQSPPRRHSPPYDAAQHYAILADVIIHHRALMKEMANDMWAAEMLAAAEFETFQKIAATIRIDNQKGR